MEPMRVGAVFRAVRLRRRWRQSDLAARVGVSTATISRIERGRLGAMSLDTLISVGAGLEIRVDVVPRWRGGELDRMLSAGHAAMHEAVVRLLGSTAWTLAPEASFAIYGERGVIDILAFHPPSGALLVVELKTELVDVQGLIGAVDRYVRLASVVGRDRGWEARTVSCWVVLRETPANHRRLAAHATVLRTAFPDDGRRVRGWLAHPQGRISALSFLSDSHARTAISASAGVQRVRAARQAPQG
jgi:transcriptional regulator with XRE-family HTH domain